MGFYIAMHSWASSRLHKILQVAAVLLLSGFTRSKVLLSSFFQKGKIHVSVKEAWQSSDGGVM